MSLSVRVVVDDDDDAPRVERPASSWAGYVHVRLMTPDVSLYLSDDAARILVEDLTHALEAPVPPRALEALEALEARRSTNE